MAKITAITAQEKNKKRCNLFIDEQFFTGVSLETVLKYCLKVGQEIDQKDLADLVLDSEKVVAIEKAVAYTSKSLKTKKQVKTYLEGKGFTYEVVKHCIDKLVEYNMIDDKEYSKRYIESASKKQGKRLTEYKLMMKGVKKDDISLAYEDSNVCDKENAKIVAEKHIRNKEKTKENIAKTYRYLIGKGFSYDEASYAISFFKEED